MPSVLCGLPCYQNESPATVQDVVGAFSEMLCLPKNAEGAVEVYRLQRLAPADELAPSDTAVCIVRGWDTNMETLEELHQRCKELQQQRDAVAGELDGLRMQYQMARAALDDIFTDREETGHDGNSDLRGPLPELPSEIATPARRRTPRGAATPRGEETNEWQVHETRTRTEDADAQTPRERRGGDAEPQVRITAPGTRRAEVHVPPLRLRTVKEDTAAEIREMNARGEMPKTEAHILATDRSAGPLTARRRGRRRGRRGGGGKAAIPPARGGA